MKPESMRYSSIFSSEIGDSLGVNHCFIQPSMTITFFLLLSQCLVQIVPGRSPSLTLTPPPSSLLIFYTTTRTMYVRSSRVVLSMVYIYILYIYLLLCCVSLSSVSSSAAAAAVYFSGIYYYSITMYSSTPYTIHRTSTVYSIPYCTFLDPTSSK